MADYLEGHSSKDTNERIDLLVTMMEAYGSQFRIHNDINSFTKYWSMLKEFFKEAIPSMYFSKTKKKKIEKCNNNIKKAEKLVEMAKIPPEKKVELGIEKSSRDLLTEAFDLLQNTELELRITMQSFGFWFRFSGRGTPGIDSLSKKSRG